MCELTWNTFRDHTILEYEIPKYDGGLGQPNFYVPVSRRCARKVELLLSAYASQRAKRWFDEDAFLALMRLRGIECNARTALRRRSMRARWWSDVRNPPQHPLSIRSRWKTVPVRRRYPREPRRGFA